ncbi:MAG: DNA-binding protein [Verrucomicrobiota bacterium]
MAQLLVRQLPDQVIKRLKKVAAESGISSEEAHRRILQHALFCDEDLEGRFAPLKDTLFDMPDIGNDADFERQKDIPQAPDLS